MLINKFQQTKLITISENLPSLNAWRKRTHSSIGWFVHVKTIWMLAYAWSLHGRKIVRSIDSQKQFEALKIGANDRHACTSNASKCNNQTNLSSLSIVLAPIPWFQLIGNWKLSFSLFDDFGPVNRDAVSSSEQKTDCMSIVQWMSVCLSKISAEKGWWIKMH